MRGGGMGGLACVAMAGALVAASMTITESLPRGSPEASAAGDESETSRLVERILEVEGWASEGFAGLSEELASRPEAPTWAEVREVMERRGCVDLRYVLRVRSLMNDGSRSDQTFVRQPYHEPWHAEEFLCYLQGDLDAAFWMGPGAPWKTATTDDDAPAPPSPR